MVASALLLLALASAIHGQNTTVSLFLPQADEQSLVGSVIGAEATATTYQIQCAAAAALSRRQQDTAPRPSAASSGSNSSSDEDEDEDEEGANECGFPTPVTIIQGPSTVSFAQTFESGTNIVNCKLAGSTQAVCTGTITGPGSNSAYSTETATLSGSELPPQSPVIITAGAEKLKATGSSSSSGSASGSASGSSGASGESSGASGTTGATAAAGAPSGTSSGASPSNTGAGVQLEPALVLGMAGVVAVGVAAFGL